jgi:hypothetical protein
MPDELCRRCGHHFEHHLDVRGAETCIVCHSDPFRCGTFVPSDALVTLSVDDGRLGIKDRLDLAAMKLVNDPISPLAVQVELPGELPVTAWLIDGHGVELDYHERLASDQLAVIRAWTDHWKSESNISL